MGQISCFESFCEEIHEFIEKWQNCIRIDAQYLAQFLHQEIDDVRAALCVLAEMNTIKWKDGWKIK